MKYHFTEKYDDKYKINNKEIACYSRSGIKDQHPDGNYTVIGETKRNNRKKKKEIGTIELGGEEMRVSEFGSHSKILYKRAQFIIDEDSGNYIVLLKHRFLILWLFLFGLLLGAGVLCAFLMLSPEKPSQPVPPPDDPKVETDTVFISIPGGTVDYRMKDGTTIPDGAEIEIYITHDGREDLIHRQIVRVNADGDIENGTLDFLSLTFELVAGDYDGRIVYTFDGKTVELKVKILIRSAKNGKIEINYSDEITVDRSNRNVALSYELGKSASHDVILQVILLSDNGSETLLSQSGAVCAGDKVTSLPLADGVKKLSAGSYDGYLRMYLLNGNDATADTATNIEMHIIVK